MGGFFDTFRKGFWNQKRRCLMLGLDAAGGRTVLCKLRTGGRDTTIPTIGFSATTLKCRGSHMDAYGVGGPDRIRALWRHYFHNTQGLVFVVDSNEGRQLNRQRHADRQSTLSNEPTRTAGGTHGPG